MGSAGVGVGVGCGGQWLRGASWGQEEALAVQNAFLIPALVGLAVGTAALVGGGLPVGFAAAEGTSRVRTPGVARMGENENAAMPAPGEASSQRRVGFENRSQEPVVLPNQPTEGRTGPIPLLRPLKMLLDLDCKNPKPSPRMPT